MELKFPENKIDYWAGQYDYPLQDTPVTDLVPEVRQCGFLTLNQLFVVAQWKSPRSAGHIQNNDEDYVRTITGFALHTENERAKIEVLTILDGVSWPTASVILHFFHAENYPILDFRALWSVGAKDPAQYTFGFWWDYVLFCRDLADRAGKDMRTLDMALWAYSKENQGAGAGDSDRPEP